MKTFHLTETENNWVLKLAGKAKPLGIYRAKDPALERAIDVAAGQSGNLVIHRKDGTIAEGRTTPVGEPGIRCSPVTSAPRSQAQTVRRKSPAGRNRRELAGAH
jgi:hypothetical protein